MRLRHRVGIGFLCGLLALIFVGWRAGPAAADSKCVPAGYDSHIYSYARWCDGSAATEVYMYSQTIGIYTNDGKDETSQCTNCEQGHFENEMWVYTQNLSLNYYVETGLYLGRNNSGTSSDPYLYIFWSDYTPTYGHANHFGTRVIKNSGNVQFAIGESSFTNWWVWDSIDNYNWGQSVRGAGVYSWAWSAGLEEFDGDNLGSSPDYGRDLIDPDEWTSGTFDNNLWVWNGSWHQPADIGHWVDRPCNPYANGYCMNGVSSGNGDWKDNIPG